MTRMPLSNITCLIAGILIGAVAVGTHASAQFSEPTSYSDHSFQSTDPRPTVLATGGVDITISDFTTDWSWPGLSTDFTDYFFKHTKPCPPTNLLDLYRHGTSFERDTSSPDTQKFQKCKPCRCILISTTSTGMPRPPNTFSLDGSPWGRGYACVPV